MRIILLLICLGFSMNASAASFFHSYVTDLSPPYMCRLKLKDARGISISPQHDYSFSGICSIKIPVGNTWVYQNIWVDLVGSWDGKTNEAYEMTKINNDLGTLVIQLKCDDDPWITKAQCAIIAYQNNSTFTNFGGVYNARTGQIPPFQTVTGQFPPLARNQAILTEAVAYSVWNAKQEAAAAHASFNQTFLNQQSTAMTAVNSPAQQPTVIKRVTKSFIRPTVNNIRLDVCLELNRHCGKPAADRFCRSAGYKGAISYKIDNKPCQPTFIIGSQTISSQSTCKGFEEIVCSN